MKVESLPAAALPERQERNVGIELFRCVSMILILVLHILGRGGVIAYAGSRTLQYRAAWFLETVGYCAVNCYALISGYVNRDKVFRIRRVVLRWMEVSFWLLIPLLAVKLFWPSLPVDEDTISKSLFPVTNKTFWYFNAYVIMSPFVPLLNRGLEGLDKRQHGAVLGFLFVTATCLHVFYGADNFVLSSGYSGLWLLILYVFGAYFRIHGIPRWARWYVTLPVFFAAAAGAWALKMLQGDLLRAGKIAQTDSLYTSLGRVVQYTSPFMLIMSVCLLILFARVSIRGEIARKVLTMAGKCSFGVYIIHVGPILWQNFMQNRFKAYAKYSVPGLVTFVILSAIGLFVVLDLLSVGRHLLFRCCGINRAVDLISDLLTGKRKKDGSSRREGP